MPTFPLDTLRLARKFRAAGHPDAETDALAEACAEIAGSDIATRQDCLEARTALEAQLRYEGAVLRTEFRDENAALRADLKNDIQPVQTHLDTATQIVRAEIRDIRLRLTKWLIPLIIAQTAATVALVKLL